MGVKRSDEREVREGDAGAEQERLALQVCRQQGEQRLEILPEQLSPL